MRNLLFQTHWLVGITAGLVLAVVGATGATLSFEKQIVAALNDGVYLEMPRGKIKDPARVAAVQAQTGREFFRDVRKLHRWLMLGESGDKDIGRQIVGACTMLLVLMSLSGLYLRWPRGKHSWSGWLAPNFSLKGRAFLWNLHTIAGTWVLLFYLLMALTGLHWSYEWYRDGVFAVFGPDSKRALFELHTGQFFGVPGMAVFMVASLCMPLFAVTGWMLYLDRRRRRRPKGTLLRSG